MAKMTVSGLKEIEAMLDTLGAEADQIASRGLYDGAGVVAEQVSQAIAKLPTDDEYAPPGEQKAGPTTYQKRALQTSLGIAPHRHKSYVTDTSVGFDGYNGEKGYNGIKSKRWPQGQPNAMVARSVERGTSFMKANPFIKKAVKAARAPAGAAMEKTIREEIQKLTK